MSKKSTVNFGAVDIGSNAIRLLVANITEGPDGTRIKKVSFTRVPIRLGEDVFSKGKISNQKKHKLAQALTGFHELIKVFDCIDYRCCATSAMRDARNGKEVVSYVEGMSGLKIEIIDGSLEAEIIFSTFFRQHLDPKSNYLYIDVGGGSTELTYIKKGLPVKSRSFNIGTVRILGGLVKDSNWEALYDWISKFDRNGHKFTAIGTGGNINKIIKMTDSKNEKMISLEKLNEFRAFLEGHTYEQLVYDVGLRSDRADVIVPAAHIYSTIMERTGIKNMFVPKVGLSDGIILDLYKKHCAVNAVT